VLVIQMLAVSGFNVIWNLQEFLSLQDCGIFLSLQDFLVLQYN